MILIIFFKMETFFFTAVFLHWGHFTVIFGVSKSKFQRVVNFRKIVSYNTNSKIILQFVVVCCQLIIDNYYWFGIKRILHFFTIFRFQSTYNNHVRVNGKLSKPTTTLGTAYLFERQTLPTLLYSIPSVGFIRTRRTVNSVQTVCNSLR